jgi:hypothetical protein
MLIVPPPSLACTHPAQPTDIKEVETINRKGRAGL